MKKLFFVFSTFLLLIGKRSNSRHMRGYYYGARYVDFGAASAHGLCSGGDCRGESDGSGGDGGNGGGGD